tara:strand:- start:72 stop:251 length:180 start_codon:yes stop_codon:yes gene_type:complete
MNLQKNRDDLGGQLMGKETAPPKVFRFNAGKTEKFDITEDTAITIADNAEKCLIKLEKF